MSDFRGPIFRPDIDAVIDSRITELRDEVAQQMYEQIQANLAASLRNPTGRYQRAVRNVEEGGSRVIDDQNIVYGPWLEGTGERNRTTRFKGYASFRRAVQAVESRLGPGISRAVGDIVRIAGGR
jgi:hypothetical protein